MKARIQTSAFHVFGSGTAIARLFIQSGNRRIEGSDPSDTDNGFVGLRSTVVDLYPKTRITYTRECYPGPKFHFQGTWEEFLKIYSPLNLSR